MDGEAGAAAAEAPGAMDANLPASGGADSEDGQVEARLREELAQLNARLASEREEMETRIETIKEKAKDHIKALQEKMQQLVRVKDEKLQELEAEKRELASELANAETRSSAEPPATVLDTAALEQECATLRAKLQAFQEQGGSGDTAVAGDGGEAAESLRSQLQAQEHLVAEAREETLQLRRDSEAKLADVVRKAKEHVKQVQSRLETSAAENKELADKYTEMSEACQQHQEKLVRYKQLMAQANSRIEESDQSLRELREALGKSQQVRVSLQDQMGSMEKVFSVPPSREEIVARGGISVAVEGDNDEIWCLIRTKVPGCEDPVEEPADDESSAGRWWLLTQLDLDEKPVPLQRRWKGEVSALRAQMNRFKKKCEDLQEEFDSYRQKANAALTTNAAHSEEILVKERKVEQLGQELHALTTELWQAQADRAKAVEDLAETRRRLQEAASKQNDLQGALERRLREAQETASAQLESCRRSLEAEREAAEQRWSEKERSYQKELDLRKSQREALEEEVEGLRARLAHRFSSADTQAESTDPSPEGDGEGAAAAMSAAPTAPVPARPAAAPAEPQEVAAPVLQEPSGSPRVPEQEAAGLPPPMPSQEQLARQPLPAQAYSLHTSVAWQDLVNLRSQVRQLELSLQEDKSALGAAKREGERAKAELREVTMQQRLQQTVGQQQQMEYIRNVFRKFVETLPVGSKEHEALVPVLMTFFKFEGEEAKAIQGKRPGPSSIWNPFGR